MTTGWAGGLHCSLGASCFAESKNSSNCPPTAWRSRTAPQGAFLICSEHNTIISDIVTATIIVILKLNGGLSLRVGSIIAWIENAIGTISNAPNVIINGVLCSVGFSALAKLEFSNFIDVSIQILIPTGFALLLPASILVFYSFYKTQMHM